MLKYFKKSSHYNKFTLKYFSQKIIRAFALGCLVSSYSFCNAKQLISLSKENNKSASYDSAIKKNNLHDKIKSADLISDEAESFDKIKLKYLAETDIVTLITNVAGVYTVNGTGENATITKPDGTSCKFINTVPPHEEDCDGNVIYEGFDATANITLDSYGTPIAINGVTANDFMLMREQSSYLINGSGTKYYASKSKRVSADKLTLGDKTFKEPWGSHFFIEITYSNNKIISIMISSYLSWQLERDFSGKAGK